MTKILNLLIAIRAFELILILTAAALVTAGAGLCVRPTQLILASNPNAKTVCSAVSFPVSEWHGSEFFGQYFVLVTSWATVLEAVIALVWFIGNRYQPIPKTFVIYIASDIILSAINGCVEAWYTAFGVNYLVGDSEGIMDESDLRQYQKIFGGSGKDVFEYHYFYVQSWAAASALFFILMLTYAADLLATYKQYKSRN